MANPVQKFIYPTTLPNVGKSRWEQLQHFIPVCRETWRKLCISGRAPRPERISLRCTVWDNKQIHLWLADPGNYRAKADEGTLPDGEVQ